MWLHSFKTTIKLTCGTDRPWATVTREAQLEQEDKFDVRSAQPNGGQILQSTLI